MNTQVGKSVGIALLLAAGLLAILFAFGVFAPSGADAAVKGGGKAPTVELSNNKPGATNVTMTITFEVNDEVDDAPLGDSVSISIPNTTATEEFTLPDTFTASNVSVRQSGANVGKVELTTGTPDDDTIVIGPADAGGNNLEANSMVTVKISGLTNPTNPSAVSIVVGQQAGTSDTSAYEYAPAVMANVFTPLTGVSATVDKTGVGEENVTLTVKFTSASGTGDVVITLPDSALYVITDGATALATDDFEVTTVPAGVTLQYAEREPDMSGATITIPNSDITANEEFVVNIGPVTAADDTISGGFTNPANSMAASISIKQNPVDPAITKTIIFTNGTEIGLKDSDGDPGVEISSIAAGAEDVSLSFNFKAAPIGATEAIEITFADGISVVETREVENDDGETEDVNNVKVYHKDVDGNKDYLDFEANYDNPDTDEKEMLSITIKDNGDDDDMAGPVRPGGQVYVDIVDMTNPTTVAKSVNIVTVTQGNFAQVSASTRLTGTEVSSNVAGSPVRLSISTEATADIPPGDDIEVNLKGFIVPESIAAHQILISGGDTVTGYTGQPFYGNPVAVAISGTKVTLTIPISSPDGTPLGIDRGIQEGGIYTITFKLGAGIKNPNVKAGDRSPSASGQTTGADNTAVLSKVNSGSASRGTLATFSVIGLKSGSATIYLMQGECIDVAPDCMDADGEPLEDDDFRIGYGLQEDGKVEVERRVTSTLFKANAYGKGPTELNAKEDGLIGTNVIYSVDGTGVLSDIHGRFTITPTVEVAPESIKQGGLLELEISDWYYGSITKLAVAGVPVTHMWTGGEAAPYLHQTADGAGEVEFIVVMPPGIRLGKQQLTLTGDEVDRQGGLEDADMFSTFINVDPLDLEVTPTNDDGMPEVVINQEFTIEGKGFNTEPGACIQSVKFGDVVMQETTAGVRVDCSTNGLKPDTAGNFSATFRLDPDLGRVENLRIGEYRVEVKDNEERVGLIDVLIPEPDVSVEPEESRRGTTVTVVGSKFPASPELAVEIRYGLAGNERTIGAATPDSSGNWRATFTVPTTAVIGEDHVIKAAPIEEVYNDFEGKGTHRLPEQEVVVKPGRVAAGGRMNLEGHNMPLFTSVRVEISGIGVSGEGFETDGIGSFVKNNILVPQLQPGIHTITAYVQTQGDRDVEVRTTVEVADIVTRPTDEVFDDLIEAGQLTVVWKYDNASGMWASYDPSAPAELNDLNEVSTGDIVWIQITENVEFQGKSLLAGWQLISLE